MCFEATMILRIRYGKTLRDVDIPSTFGDLKPDDIIQCVVDGINQAFIVDIPPCRRSEVIYVRAHVE